MRVRSTIVLKAHVICFFSLTRGAERTSPRESVTNPLETGTTCLPEQRIDVESITSFIAAQTSPVARTTRKRYGAGARFV